MKVSTPLSMAKLRIGHLLNKGQKYYCLSMLSFMCLRSTVKKLGYVCDVIHFQNCYYVGSHTLYMYCRVHVKL